MGPLRVDCRCGAGHGGRRPLRSSTASTGASVCAGRRVEGTRVGGCLLGASMDLAGYGSAHQPLYRLGRRGLHGGDGTDSAGSPSASRWLRRGSRLVVERRRWWSEHGRGAWTGGRPEDGAVPADAERRILSLALRTASHFGYCQPFSDTVGAVLATDAPRKPGLSEFGVGAGID